MTSAQALEIHRKIEGLQAGINRLIATLDKAWEESNKDRGNYRMPDHMDVIELVSDAFGLDRSQLCAKSNREALVRPRMIAQYLMRTVLCMSFPEIAIATKRAHHTTALHAIVKIERERKTDAELDSLIVALQKRLKERFGKEIA